ncbi:hypothetical protein, partial [Salmonella enterica]|uniref:hypothetical protein n=1 Tax=Salmonella enterica TaxID=28901 RepID=UPI00398C830F
GRIAISEHQQISLPVKESTPVTVALNPTYNVRGRLSANVPRPVNGMLLEYAVAPGKSDSDSVQKLTVQRSEVDADGCFVLTGIPKNTLTYVSALGHNYCSAPGRTEPGMYSGQTFVLHDPEQLYELPMIQTASVALSVIDFSNNPVVGARVRTLPT